MSGTFIVVGVLLPWCMLGIVLARVVRRRLRKTGVRSR